MTLKRKIIFTANILIGSSILHSGLANAAIVKIQRLMRLKEITNWRTRQYADQNEIDFSCFADCSNSIDRNREVGPPNDT
jgi:hypothetical protein